jgi:hypothetical protein
MRKRTLMNFTILLFLSVLAIYPTWAGTGKHGKILAENRTWDFGFVPLDYKLIHIYKIKNIGDGDLHIEKMVPNCDCTMVTCSDTLVRPDSTVEIKIIFDTKNYYGLNNREITVHSDDPENPTINLEYSSNIGLFPNFYQIEPHSLFFLKGNKSQTIRLSNLSDEDLDYNLELEPDSFFTVDKTSGLLDSKKDVSIEVTPNDQLNKGTFHSSFRVKFDTEPDPVIITIPVKIVRY